MNEKSKSCNTTASAPFHFTLSAEYPILATTFFNFAHNRAQLSAASSLQSPLPSQSHPFHNPHHPRLQAFTSTTQGILNFPCRIVLPHSRSEKRIHQRYPQRHIVHRTTCLFPSEDSPVQVAPVTAQPAARLLHYDARLPARPLGIIPTSTLVPYRGCTDTGRGCKASNFAMVR